MTRAPNHQLAGVMEQAGISNKGLAALVRAEAARRRLAIAPDHVSVRRWLDGGNPRGDTAACVTGVLSARIGRRLTAGDLGFEVPDKGPGLSTIDVVRYSTDSADSVALLDRLTSADLDGNPAVDRLEWAPDATPEIVTGYLFSQPSHADSEPLTSDRNPATRIRATIRNFADLDFQFGGGHTRGMLLYFWKREILPLLQRSHPEPVRREVFAAAADAAEVLGWSAYDAGQHGAAQRYFAYGLSLAQESGDRLMGGQILSNLSHQANYLGRFSEAAQLARAAQAAITGNRSATVSAMFLAMEARALASQGQVRECVRVLNAAERIFESRDVANDPDWISYFDELELAGEAAHCFRDMGMASETQAFALQAIDPVLTPARTRAFIIMVNAAGALRAGNVDEALHLASSAVELTGSLRSDRSRRYVSDFYALLTAEHGSHGGTAAFGELIAATAISEGSPF